LVDIFSQLEKETQFSQPIHSDNGELSVVFVVVVVVVVFTCVSYAEARNSYSLDVRPSVRHTLALYQNG